MADLKYIAITQLFWDTLEKHRGHSRYPEIRAKIAWCVERKAEDRTFQNNSDAAFLASASKWLVGLWHCKLSTNPDVVMFYTLDGETMNLAMVGSHHDYPHQGKHVHKSESLGKKVRASVDRGHVPSPNWSRIKWNVPADITRSFELEETTLDHLAAIEEELKLENQDGPIFERVHGYRLEDADIDTLTQWLDETDLALAAVDRAIERVRNIVRGKETERAPIAVFAPKLG